MIALLNGWSKKESGREGERLFCALTEMVYALPLQLFFEHFNVGQHVSCLTLLLAG